MRRLTVAIVLLVTLASARGAAAHPAPFSYIDLHVGATAIDLTVVAHVFDLAHDLAIADSTQLLDPAFAAARAPAIAALLAPRLVVDAGSGPLACAEAGGVQVLASRQSVATRFSCPLASAPGRIALRTLMFGYDPQHQTFVNVYEEGTLRKQAILDGGHVTLEYFPGTRQGVLAVIARFLPAGIHHILIGPDHLLFLVGLLLLGGTIRQLLIVVTAFTVAHSLTLSLAALNLVTPSPRLIEPAIALSIVYVGLDNLMVRGGRDVRAWIAFVFGFVHGFGFASVLREMDLPPRALGWSLFSFNAGVEIGQMLVVVVVASGLMALRARSAAAGERLAVAGSIVVVAAGAFWFVQRVFFPGGLS